MAPMVCSFRPAPIPSRHGRVAATVCALVVMVSLAACAELEEPYLGAEVTVGSSAPGSPLVAIPGNQVEDRSTVTIGPMLPPRDPDYIPVLVVASPSGIVSGIDTVFAALAEPLGSLPAGRTSDDLFGGLVVESVSGEILWFPAEGAAANSVREPGHRLLDVGYLNNTSEALVMDTNRLIERVRLVDGESEPIIVLADDTALLDFAAAGGLYALAIGDAQCGHIAFLNSLGEPVDITVPPGGECPVPRRATYTLLDLSPDGDALAYTEVRYRSDGVEASTELVGYEIGSRVELFRIQIGAAGDDISSLSFDGRRVAFVRAPLGGGTSQVVVLDPLGEGVAGEAVAEVARSSAIDVSFARLPLKVGAEAAG